MKKFFLFLYVACSLLVGCTDNIVQAQGPVIVGTVPPVVSNVVKLYIAGGQSNMPSEVTNYFQGLMNSLAPGRVRVVLESQSGATMLGQGGSNDWKVDEISTGVHYANLKAAVLAELADIVADGFTPDIRGFLWRQGEAERAGVGGFTDVQLRAAMTLQLNRLIQFLADDINEAGYDVHNMRVLVYRIHATVPGASAPMLAAIRASEDTDMPAFTTNFTGYATNLIRDVDFVDTDALSYAVDLLHYSAPTGQQQAAQLGYDYFAPFIDETNTLPTINTAGFDGDAILALTAMQSRVQAQADEVNDLVVTAKADGWWTPAVAIYTMVGGHRVAHRVNIKDPDNSDGYQLTFNKSVSHDDDGFYGDAIAGYAETHIPQSTLGQNTAGAFFYSNTSAQEAKYGWGVLAAGNASRFYWAFRWTDNLNYPACQGSEGTGLTTTDGSEVHIISRTANNNYNTYDKGVKRSYSNTSSAPDATTIPVGARSSAGAKNSFSSRSWGPFGFFNASLSDANALSIRTTINTFEAGVR